MIGKRLKLRAIEMADLEIIHRWENQPEIWSVSEFPGPYSKLAIEKYIRTAITSDILAMRQVRFMIETLEPVKTIGMIDLFDIDTLNSRAGVGIMLDPEARSKGYALDALNLLIDYAFVHLGLHQLYAIIGASNQASLKLFTACGFKLTGRKTDWRKKGNHWEDELFLQLINFSDLED